MPNIGAPELIIILVIALIVLGPGRLPDVAASLGKGVREFRRAATDLSDSTKLEPDKQPPTAGSSASPPVNTLADASAPNSLGEGSSSKPAATDGDHPAT